MTSESQLLQSLRLDAKHFGETLAEQAYRTGLAVTGKDGSTLPIPITATPVVISRTELEQRQRLAALLASAGAKVAHAVLRSPSKNLLLDGLSPLEKSLAEDTFERALRLITTRVDFFVSEKPWALELNATIPAMQGYSDIAANTFIEVVGRFWGAKDHMIARWQAANGSNTLALYRALLDGFALERPGQSPKAIALLSRRNDAQLTEQQYLCQQFRNFGADADVVHPDELSGDDAVSAHGKTYDLIYRHLFVRRLEEPDLQGSAYVTELLRNPTKKNVVVLNAPASHVEAKRVFAWMSQATEGSNEFASAAKLSEDELQAISEGVPWTRIFDSPEIAEKVAANPKEYVLKRSWDYGGRAVFVGRTAHEPSFDERVRAAFGESLDWKGLCQRALTDSRGGGFIVQKLVETEPQNHLLCSAYQQTETPLYVDFSAYASVGMPSSPKWGGVCRGSISNIVNIVGGGGVIPLLTQEVADSLATLYRADLPPAR